MAEDAKFSQMEVGLPSAPDSVKKMRRRVGESGAAKAVLAVLLALVLVGLFASGSGGQAAAPAQEARGPQNRRQEA